MNKTSEYISYIIKLCTCYLHWHILTFKERTIQTKYGFIGWYIFLTYLQRRLFKKQISEIFQNCKPSIMFKVLLFSNFRYMAMQLKFTCMYHFCERMRAYKAGQIPRSDTQDIWYFKIQRNWFYCEWSISLDFEILDILCPRVGDLTRLIRPHSLEWKIKICTVKIIHLININFILVVIFIIFFKKFVRIKLLLH
jgi:hypothetical protein